MVWIGDYLVLSTRIAPVSFWCGALVRSRSKLDSPEYISSYYDGELYIFLESIKMATTTKKMWFQCLECIISCKWNTTVFNIRHCNVWYYLYIVCVGCNSIDEFLIISNCNIIFKFLRYIFCIQFLMISRRAEIYYIGIISVHFPYLISKLYKCIPL